MKNFTCQITDLHEEYRPIVLMAYSLKRAKQRRGAYQPHTTGIGINSHSNKWTCKQNGLSLIIIENTAVYFKYITSDD
jgi:hypothetical protein